MLHLSLYFKDVLHFAKSFLNRANIGVERQQPRSLRSLAEASSQSLEDRNKQLLDACFYKQNFQGVREVHQRAGVSYTADSLKVLRNEDLALTNRLQPGWAQFFSPGTEPGPNEQSYWVAAEGWFYVLSFVELPTAQKAYATPDWAVQAGLFFCFGGAG